MVLRKVSSLDSHLYNLGNAILGVLYPDDNIMDSSSNIAVNWLQTAASIKSIDVNLFTFDPTPAGYCESVDDYTAARSKILQSHVLLTTKFLYAWSALEDTIKYIAPPKNPSSKFEGSIYDACGFIKLYFTNQKPLPVYRFLFEHYLEHLKKSEDYLSIYNNQSSKNIYGIDAFGLYLVSLIRNRFAHGEAKFPDHNIFEESEIQNDLIIIRLSTRIILFSIQMLFLAKYESTNTKITYTRRNSSKTRIVSLGTVFRNIY